MSGVVLCRTLKSLPALSDTPVIAVAKAPRARDLRAAAQAGCARVLVQPCLPDELSAAIHEVISSARDLRARSTVALARAESLRHRSTRVLEQSAVIHSRRAGVAGEVSLVPCPSCRTGLRWRDHQDMAGQSFDYFEACNAGCGEYCFDHRRRRWLKLR
jgi:hypothetical protein